MKQNIKLEIRWETPKDFDDIYSERVQCAIITALHSLDVVRDSATFVLSSNNN